MKEAYIRKKVREENVRQGYVCWNPQVPKNTYASEKDIFGVFDIVCVRGVNDIRWIQFTTYANVSAPKTKVLAFFRKTKAFLEGAQIWGYNKEKREFRKVYLTPQDVENG